MHCSKGASVEVSAEGLARYRGGEVIQKAFPELSNGEREIILSGTHPECWEAMWAEDDDEEDTTLGIANVLNPNVRNLMSFTKTYQPMKQCTCEMCIADTVNQSRKDDGE
jgi:hypothetical protein